MSRRGVTTAILGVAGAAALLTPVTATAQSTALSSARGSGSGLYLRVDDPSLFLEDTIFAPPEVHVAYARAEVERAGGGSALAGTGYTEYLNVLGAVPELGPAFLPPELLPVFDLFLEVLPPGLPESVSNLTSASVRGSPPKYDEATTVPGEQAAGGVMEAELSDGPRARATASMVDLPVSILLRVAAGDTETVITPAGSGRQATVTTTLRDVTIAEVLEIDAIRVTATANANGAEGVATGEVVVDGVTVAGLPARLDADGLHLLDEVVPIPLDPVADLLAEAGVGSVRPGGVETERSGESAEAVAIGPTVTLRTPEGQEVRLTLGRAVASSDFAELPPPPTTSTPPAPTAPTPPPDDEVAASTPPTTPPTGSGSAPAPRAAGPSTTPPTTPTVTPPVVAPTSPTDPAGSDPTLAMVDLERLVLANDEARSGIEDVYIMLFLPLLVLAALGAVRPWRAD